MLKHGTNLNKILRKVKDQKNSINGKYVMNILKKDLKFCDRVQLLMAYSIILEGEGESKMSQFLFYCRVLVQKAKCTKWNGDSMAKRKETPI